ncbi:MAG: ABC transporter permease subunit [Acidobacteria bacterium]|nr:ABC transporter permease subunit [Acidobacteriota bacterium]
MPFIEEMPQALGVARLQLKLLMRKRFILVLAALWLIHVILVLELGRTALALLVIPSFQIPDLLVIAMACGLIADDAEHGTFPFMLSHPIERRTFLLGKLLPVVVLTLGVAVVAHTATVVIMRTYETASIAISAGPLVMAYSLSLARILVVTGITAWMAVTFTNRYMAAIGSLLYVYGFPYMLQSLLSPQSPGVGLAESFLPWRDSFERVAAGLFSRETTAGMLAAAVVQPLLYAAIFGVLAARTFERRDLGRTHF